MKRYRKFKPIIFIRIAVLLLIGFMFLFDFQWRPMLFACAQSQANVQITQAINDAIEVALANQNQTISFADVKYSDSGAVQSLTVDSKSLNKLKADFIDSYIADSEYILDFSVTLGTLSGISYFNCMGPFMRFFAELSHYPDAQFVSRFVSEGINQTLHRVVLRVGVEINYIFPGGNKTDILETEYVISETLIVGNVPNSYTNIIQNGKTIPDTAETVKIFGD